MEGITGKGLQGPFQYLLSRLEINENTMCWSAFFYESSIKQLAELSSKFIISDSTSPTWIALMLPSLLLVNLAFLLGSSVCIVLEMLPRFAKTYSFSAAV